MLQAAKGKQGRQGCVAASLWQHEGPTCYNQNRFIHTTEIWAVALSCPAIRQPETLQSAVWHVSCQRM